MSVPNKIKQNNIHTHWL